MSTAVRVGLLSVSWCITHDEVWDVDNEAECDLPGYGTEPCEARPLYVGLIDDGGTR